MNITITGGAGFIGYHCCRYFAEKKYNVILLDDFSRRGSGYHAKKLVSEYGQRIKVVECDISNTSEQNITLLNQACGSANVVLHLAAQVAVTTSVLNPRRDFEVNALGTLNVLESCKLPTSKPFLIYSSTNKVYGEIEDATVIEKNQKYLFKDLPNGVAESSPLDFHSPYGCSKGAADQYVRDYNRIYELPSVVLRQSCIYGSDQYGHEDQGWIAHFALNAIRDLPVKIFGDGKQVRDALYADDLIDLYDRCIQNQSTVSGKVYNVGGGPNNILSLLELIEILENLLGKKIEKSFHEWRPGDQKVYISNISSISKALDWQPQTSPYAGIKNMVDWAISRRLEIEDVLLHW